MSASRFKSKHGGFQWEDDSAFVYKQKKTYKSGWIYMVCVKKECPGSCKVKCVEEDSSRGECVVITAHLPESACKNENSALRVEALRSTILQRAKTENTPNSIIFQQEINKAPVDIRNSLNFKEMERTMQRVHKSANPGSVKTFEDFATLITQWHEKYGLINNEQFFLGRFGEGSEECLIALVSPLTQVLQTSDEWHLDGTFKCRPKEPKFGQLFVVMASEHGRAFPIAWVLMMSRTTRAYNVVFKALKNHIPDLSPELIISDYEKAIHASVRLNFPNAKHTGCWFHFSQAIDRKSRKLGLKHGEQGGCDVAKRLMTTALLPHDRIPEAVQVIEQLVESTSTAYRTKAKRLLEYFKGEWMAKVTPLAFSVYGQTSRTNNCQESLNRNINRSIKPQGNTWDFWGGLMAISVKEINYHSQLQQGMECARARKNKWLLQDINLTKLQRKIVEGRISLAAFLTAASHRIATPTPIAADRRGDDIEDVDDVELSSLDVVQVEAVVRREINPYANYRWEATQLVPNNFMRLSEVSQQRLEMERSVGAATVEEREPAGEGCAACVFCHEYKPTRLCSPCGHANMCSVCSVDFVRRESYYSVTNERGDIEETEIRLPLTCPVCRAIIGQIIRVYIN